jgi:hypothetical protein
MNEDHDYNIRDPSDFLLVPFRKSLPSQGMKEFEPIGFRVREDINMIFRLPRWFYEMLFSAELAVSF